MEARRLVPLGVALYGVMIGASVLWGWSRGHWMAWFPAPTVGAWAAGLGVGVVAGVVGVGFTLFAENKSAGVRALVERFGTIVAGLPTSAVLVLALLSGIGEELLFRGCLQQEIGLVPATILFAVVHTGKDRVFRWWTLGALLYGLVLGALVWWPGGLVAPITMHVVINGINLWSLSGRGVRADRPGALPPPARSRFEDLKVR